MRNPKLVLIALLLANTLFGQKFTVQIGPEFKADRDLDFWGHLYSDPTGHWVLLTDANRGMFTYKSFTPVLQKYDRSFKLDFFKEIKVDDEDIQFKGMFYAQQKFVLCTQKNDKKADKITYSATLIGMDGKPQKPQRISVLQYDNKNTEPTNTTWRISEDTSKILLATWADRNDDDLKLKLALFVHDNQLNKLWSKNFNLPYSQERFQLRNVTVSNDGRVYVLAKVYDEKSNKESRKKNGKQEAAYKMVILRFDDTNEKPKEFVLSLAGKFVTDVTFKLAHNNDLYCAGFYANDKRGVIRGVFFTRINGQTGTAEVATSKELASADIARFDTEKDKSGDEGLDSNFDFKRLVLRDDGGIVVIAEQVYVTTSTTMSGNRMRTVYYYNNNEIFVTSIAPDGAIEWVRMVPKKQTFVDTNYFNGFSLMVSGGNMYFLYNEDEDNIGKPLTAKPKRISSFKDAVAGMVTLSFDGKMERSKIFNSKEDADALMAPADGEQISPNELFFITTRFKLFGSKKLRMGVVRVD